MSVTTAHSYFVERNIPRDGRKSTVRVSTENKEGMLRPSLNRRRWEWDVKKIRSAMFLTESLEELPDIGNCYPLTNMRTRHISKSNQPIAAASSPEPVPLKQWMVGAVDSLRSRSEGGKGEIVCSHEYLPCALQIPHSLANQLSPSNRRGRTKKRPLLCATIIRRL